MSNPSADQPTRNWLALSLAQQSVWLDAKLSGTSVYQLGGWARIAAPLDEAIVRQSVRLMMGRHDALRLRVDDELPRQWVDDSSPAPVEVIEWGQIADPDNMFAEHVKKLFATSMPLGDQPLLRIELIKAGPNLNYLLWRFHHLIADSASVSIALSHWFNAYDALTASEPQELAPPSSYLKTISSDAMYLQSAQHHQDLSYWENRFDPMPPQLIADMEHRANPTTSVPVANYQLTDESFVQFQTACKAAGITVNRALFGLFASVLSRRYGQNDLVAGIALHRRDLSNLHVVGMMAGVIAVRICFEPHWSLEDCISALAKQLDSDLRHQRMPVDVLSRSLGLSGTGRAGLFEAAMSYIPVARQGNDSLLDGLRVTTGVVETREASPISLHATELFDNKGLGIRVAVNPDFLDPSESNRLAELLQSAVEQFVADSGTAFDEMPAITNSERELLVEKWNHTETIFEPGTLDGLFVSQAGHTPDAVAVVDLDGSELTYAQLNERSTTLAKHLVSVGVVLGSVVGVRMVRSTDTVIALLGILKAGGVYLPLDPAYPSDRLQYIAADAGAMLVLDSIDGLSGDADLPALSDPDRLAYVIYTSGTTGRPKGVAVPHSAAVNLAFARKACHDPLNVGDRVLAAISVGFDVSIGQLLLSLLSGATVVIAGDVKTMGATEFWSLLVHRSVTHINSVPSFFDSILDSVPPAGSLSLKRLMLGGEALSGALVARIQKAVPGIQVVNMYGPTEACIDATYHIATEKDLTEAVLPIGKPLSNYQAYVLNTALEPVGIGVSGELYLGGAGLAHGYVNAPELTAERFIPNPFITGAKLYKTGDRARWRADGAIQFLGRADQQVKIRGFRVEPAEVETALLGHNAIAQAVVIPRSSNPAVAPRLIAYIVPHSPENLPQSSELRDYLSKSLPEYMIPTAFVILSEIPLGRNGKLDVNALPSPDLQEGEYVPPRTPTEQTIANLFSDVLGLDRCSATDNFFELGGHSLLATSLVSRMHGIGMNVPLRAIFETPTVEMLARRIDASLPAVEAGPSIRVQQRGDWIPLSYPQERIWFVDRLQQDSSYNIPIAVELEGQLNRDAAELAVHRIVGRHPVLRTLIKLHDGRPIQSVVEDINFDLSPIDLTHLAADDRQVELDRVLGRLVRHRFDLANDLPIQIVLIDLKTDHHVMAAVIHHSAFDGWSAGVFFKEFFALYAAYAAEMPDPLPMPAIEYADFAIWQRKQSRETDLAYWVEVLLDAPPRLELPVVGTAENTRRAGTLPFTLDSGESSRLLKLANDSGASLFMLLHAAFALLMSRISGQDDVVIGTVTAGRNHTELESLIGCFVNTLPLRTVFKPGETFAELLSRIKSEDLAAYAHQDLPFEQLVDALAPERSMQYTPVFQVMLVLQNAPMSAASMPGLEIRSIEIPAETAKLDLTLSLTEQQGSLTGAIEYAQNRFSHEWIEGLADKFKRLLTAVITNPQLEAVRVDVLGSDERELLVEKWNHTETIFEPGTLDGLFVSQAGHTPDAVAVVDLDGSELTYAQLNERSTTLAKHLVSVGVVLGSVVGVRMVRSTDTVIALLGILKAGGVYLPLDPAYPSDRLQYIAADAGAMLVLDSIDGLSGDADLPALSDPDRLAYVIYTSGTTGRPKGVAVPHSAAVNLAFARKACHDPLNVGDRVLAAISVGFDVSIGQLLLSLLSGATVVIAGDVKTMGATEFWSLLVHRSVTHINSVPSFFDSILDSVPPAGSLSLKRLMLGGEALSGALVARIQKAVPGIQVVNMYGPTEACIDATYHIATEKDLTEAVLPIGKPLSNYQAYVLNTALEPVGIGVSGELYLGGAGLAHGYVNAPELTAERFIPNPFITGAKLYKTGDRARWRADGAIQFLGRADQQVKIRGFRVEPAEVETQLRLQAGVRDAAVVTDHTGGNTRLIAYCTGDVTPEGLRAGLASILPDYMVPVVFIKLEELPLTPNGKLNRKALPKPAKWMFATRSYESPTGENEQRMAAIWAETLGVDRVGRHDNFFELGGHSLLAVTLVERLHNQGLPGDVRGLFTSPTVAGLSALSFQSQEPAAPPNLIRSAGCDRITPQMLPLVELTQSQVDSIVAGIPGQAANVQDVYPLAPLQEGILFQHLLGETGDPYLAPMLLAFDSRDRLDSLLVALNQLISRHDVLRTAMIWKDLDMPLQVVQRHAALPIEEILLDHKEQTAAEQLLARFDPSHYRIDLSKAPLMRCVAAFDQTNNRWLLLLLLHHLILDQTSMAIVAAELRALMIDTDASLPPAIPYRNFIASSRGGKTRADYETFFTRMLSTVDEPTAPFGMLNVHDAGTKITEARLSIDPATSTRIRKASRTLGVSPASFFHLAWAIVLGYASGKSDVVFGTVLLGRMRSGAGANQVVGMFINTLPIRVELDHASSTEGLVRMHRLLADLLEHEHAPLTLAQRCGSVPPPGPLFSSLFNYRFSPAESESRWDGVEVVASKGATNYPLAMAVDDRGEDFLLSASSQPGADAARICQYLQTAAEDLLDRLEIDSTEPLRTLRTLPAGEQNLVVEEWNQTAASFEVGTLDGLFVAQAHRTPDAVSVVGLDGSELTYAQLDQRSTTLAKHLVSVGVTPDRVVGVRMVRNTETVIAILGILKAGGVYLPLDPAYPPERLKYIADNAGAMIVLETIDGLTGDAELPVLDDPDRLAYVIYTSGTTGQPKGVAVPHKAAVNLAFARKACHDPLSAGDRVLAAISVGFDVSFGQLLLPLLSGATVVIADDVKTMGALEFWSLLVNRGVTHINSVPSFFDSILDSAPPAGSLRLKRLMLGGEALSGTLVGRIQRAVPGIQVVNMYGPTEACIDATYHLANDKDLNEAVLPIGKPLSNYQAYVLSSTLQAVGIGVSGELYLGGAGLARGYVNSPELTAERFVDSPFVTGAKLYKTGDRARWRADGVIQFLGRVDQQVKIRGFRVEPGEVEAQLRLQSGVRDAAVVTSTGEETTRLIAYFVGDIGIDQLRTGLLATLPDYMVPAAFIKLNEMPLTPNGKLDRKALPSPAVTAVADSAFEAPVGEMEQRMALLWADLLKLDRVGRYDNFFEIGGDSLVAMRLVNAASLQFNTTVPVRLVFQYPTVQSLIAEMYSVRKSTRSRNLVPLRTTGSRPNLYCIHASSGHVFGYLNLMRALGPDQPIYGLQTSGLEDGERFADSFEQSAAEYVAAIQEIQPHGPYYLLGFSSGGLLAFEMARQFKDLGEEMGLVVILDTTLPDPNGGRTVTQDEVVLDTAGSLGIGDLIAKMKPLPALDQLVDIARKAGRLPVDLESKYVERMGDSFRNTVRIVPDHKVRGGYDGRTLLVRATKRPPPPVDWSPYIVPAALEIVEVNCIHTDLIAPRIVPKLAKLLAERIPSLPNSDEEAEPSVEAGPPTVASSSVTAQVAKDNAVAPRNSLSLQGMRSGLGNLLKGRRR